MVFPFGPSGKTLDETVERPAVAVDFLPLIQGALIPPTGFAVCGLGFDPWIQASIWASIQFQS